VFMGCGSFGVILVGGSENRLGIGQVDRSVGLGGRVVRCVLARPGRHIEHVAVLPLCDEIAALPDRKDAGAAAGSVAPAKRSPLTSACHVTPSKQMRAGTRGPRRTRRMAKYPGSGWPTARAGWLWRSEAAADVADGRCCEDMMSRAPADQDGR
jgi:hypothetical protein